MIDCVISYYGDGECIDPHSVRASVVLVELRHCYRFLYLHDQRRDQATCSASTQRQRVRWIPGGVRSIAERQAHTIVLLAFPVIMVFPGLINLSPRRFQPVQYLNPCLSFD